jgi:hypothetical protein
MRCAAQRPRQGRIVRHDQLEDGAEIIRTLINPINIGRLLRKVVSGW